MRWLPTLLCALLGLALFASDAAAEDVFVLKNGSTLRGFVVRETDEKLVVRLSGFTEVNEVTVRRTEVVRRYTTRDPHRTPAKVPIIEADPAPGIDFAHVPDVSADRVPVVATPPTPPATTSEEPPSAFEPALASEGFFERLRRVTGMALPRSLEGLLLIGVLFFIVLTVLVAGGARVIGMKAPSLQACSSLGLLLGVFLAADIGLHHELLRADRAIWILPLQAGVWLFVARSALDAPLPRVVPLFAFALFGSACFIFFTGSVLVSL